MNSLKKILILELQIAFLLVCAGQAAAARRPFKSSANDPSVANCNSKLSALVLIVTLPFEVLNVRKNMA